MSYWCYINHGRVGYTMIHIHIIQLCTCCKGFVEHRYGLWPSFPTRRSHNLRVHPFGSPHITPYQHMGRTNSKWLRRFCPVSFLHLERNSHAENVQCEPLSTGPVGDGLLVSDCMAGSSVPLQGFALEGVATGILATKLAMRTWKHSEDWQLDPYVLVSVSNKVIQFSLILGVRMQTINRNNIRNGGVQIYSKQTMGVASTAFQGWSFCFESSESRIRTDSMVDTLTWQTTGFLGHEFCFLRLVWRLFLQNSRITYIFIEMSISSNLSILLFQTTTAPATVAKSIALDLTCAGNASDSDHTVRHAFRCIVVDFWRYLRHLQHEISAAFLGFCESLSSPIQHVFFVSVCIHTNIYIIY